MRKIFLFLFIFILLVSPLSAINPQFQQSTEGIDIDYPKYTTLQQDKPADFILERTVRAISGKTITKTF